LAHAPLPFFRFLPPLSFCLARCAGRHHGLTCSGDQPSCFLCRGSFFFPMATLFFSFASHVDYAGTSLPSPFFKEIVLLCLGVRRTSPPPYRSPIFLFLGHGIGLDRVPRRPPIEIDLSRAVGPPFSSLSPLSPPVCHPSGIVCGT